MLTLLPQAVAVGVSVSSGGVEATSPLSNESFFTTPKEEANTCVASLLLCGWGKDRGPLHCADRTCLRACPPPPPPPPSPPPAPLSPCSAPAVRATAISGSIGRATITPPTTKRPWAKYRLTVCKKGANPPSCRTITPLCTANANRDGTTSCNMPGLTKLTTYTVTAVAIQADGTTESLVSAPAEFTTPDV